EREGVDTRPEDRDDSEDRDTLPEDRDDPEDGRDDTVPEDRDDDRDTSPVDLVDEPDLPASCEGADPDRSDRLGEASPLPRVVLSVDDLGYHSTPPGVLVIVRVVVRSERPNVSDDRVVDRVRVAAPEVFDRSTVRPPSLYLVRPVSAVLVLTRVDWRVGVVERVELLDPTVVPEEPPTPLRPTKTPRSTVSPSR
ncbi:MAG TPA: hypothetical protein VMO47_17715, partial [Rhodothermales bacterium]|nr:hypothetical protein [Rhodothermales bacterium]